MERVRAMLSGDGAKKDDEKDDASEKAEKPKAAA
jgi:hypothetical protein